MNPRESEWATTVAQEFFRTGDLPTHDRVNQLSITPYTPQFSVRCYGSDEVLNYLEALGVPVRQKLQKADYGALTAEQLVCVNTLLDFNDTRSDKKKLEGLGISSSKYQAWKKDPAFQNYIRERAENLLGDNSDEINRALLDTARSGDIGAIKFFYEITGRYNPKADGQIDARALLIQIQEIILRRVKDPEVIQQIAADFQLLSVNNRMGQPVIEGVAQRQLPA